MQRQLSDIRYLPYQKGVYYPSTADKEKISVGAERQRRYRAVRKLRTEPTEEHLWEVVLLYADVRFKTYSGLPFTYEIRKGRNWLSYNLRKSIRERLRKMSKREKKEFIQRSGGEAFLERMNQYPFKVAEMRGDKDIGMASNDSPIREYQNILDEMIAIYKSIGE